MSQCALAGDKGARDAVSNRRLTIRRIPEASAARGTATTNAAAIKEKPKNKATTAAGASKVLGHVSMLASGSAGPKTRDR
jgi:hypothetical protein